MSVPPSPRPRLLVVDDDSAILNIIERVAVQAGFDVETCPKGSSAMDRLLRQPADLAMVDLHMPDANGIELLKRFKAVVPVCEVILMTAFGGVASAVEAMKYGAREYLTKPFDLDRLRTVLAEVRGEWEQRARLTMTEGDMAQQLEFCGMLGRSAVMQDVFSVIQRMAPHTKVALITGETGTGKDLAARAFHQAGPRRARRFVSVHCSAFDEDAIESADGATLFLDEIGELPSEGQATILRLLEAADLKRESRPLRRMRDIAIIAASRRDLRAEVAAGRFRDDLFYRLSVVEIRLPPLRDRREDIPHLAAGVMREMAIRLRRPLNGLTASAERMLLSAPWPGNVRELKNAIERACILTSGTLVSAQELIPAMKGKQGPSPAGDGATLSDADLERDRIVETLHQVRGNRMAAAKLLGISRRALYRRLARYDIGAEAPSRRAYLPRPR
jgi:DNA-binding NtrC family response regulator